MNRSIFWKVPLALVGVVVGLVLVLLVTLTCVVRSSSARTAIKDKGVEWANNNLDYDIDLSRLYLSPFSHSPLVFYRAYKGKADMPLQIEIDSLFIGHRGQDTLLYVNSLRLRAKALTKGAELSIEEAIDSNRVAELTALPIVVDYLSLDDVTIHSDTLIAAVAINAIVQHLELNSPQLNLAKGQFPLHDLKLQDAFIGIDLRDTPPDTTDVDTTATLMAFSVPDAELRNVRFLLTPTDLDVYADTLSVNVLADVGGSQYDVRRINIGSSSLALGSLFIPVDTLYGDAFVDLSNDLITSRGLHARSDSLGAEAHLTATRLNLETMRIDLNADAQYQGSKADIKGFYNIDNEAYDLQIDVEQVDLGAFLKDSPPLTLAGEIKAEGRGIDLESPSIKSKINMHLTDCVYDNIDVSGVSLDAQLSGKTVEGTLHLPVLMNDSNMHIKAQTDHRFHVSNFLTPEKIGVDLHSKLRKVSAHVAGEDFSADKILLDFTTDSTTSLALSTQGLDLKAESPMHVLRLLDEVQPLLSAIGDSAIINPIVSLHDLTMIDTLRALIPDINANIALSKGSPVQHIIENMGLDVNKADLSLVSDSVQTDFAFDASIPEINHPEDSIALRLPALKTALRMNMSEGKTTTSLTAGSHITDGAMSLHGVKTDAALNIDLERTERELSGDGHLALNNLFYGDMNLGDRSADIALRPSEQYQGAVRADVRLDDIPLELVDSIINSADIDLRGAVRAKASIDGLPDNTDIYAEVLPLEVAGKYKPYDVELALGETPVIMEHNRVDLNGLPIYGVDSTYLTLTGDLDLNTMLLDITLEADSFAPAKLQKDGPFPVHGDLATDIRGKVTGSLDSIMADVDISVLPVTDITYPIDKKNMAQLKPHGLVNVKYGVADGSMNLGGRIDVDEGVIRFSPKAYPIMPFKVDSGSYALFNGPLGQTHLNVSASQKVKADVQSEGQETRRVDFVTGVRVNGVLDSIGLNALSFFLEAPKDEVITREIASLDEDTREGLAATLLATGMYVGESNAAAQRDGYALSSIINSRINAALANSKLGKAVDIDISSAQTNHAAGKTNDMNISISKSMFHDKLRVTIGSAISDNPEVNNTNGLLQNISADYKLTNNGDVLLRLFSQRDYNNILEGELYKSGLGVRANKDWKRQHIYLSDTIVRTYSLGADADVAYRSNNSIGPNLTIKSSIRNLLGHGETLIVKGNGAYYWALRDRHPGDPKKTDTYKLGVNTSLIFPYLHWLGDNNPEGDTRYMLGYQYENIAGGYGVHKLSGSFTYFIRSSKYITHAFTPFSLSIVFMKAQSEDLLDKAAEYPQLIKILAGNEFVPSISYNFNYNDYHARRPVNTMFDFGIKESGNLINAIYCAFGHKWDEMDKPLGKITFNQFVKLNLELRNRFNFTDKVCIATRLYGGANIPLGNSFFAPLSEAFYTGGPNSLRASAPYAYGPGNFYSAKYNQNFFHAGDIKLEANFELRFPIVWKLYGAAFLDAGNVWNWHSTVDLFKAAGYDDYLTRLEIPEDLKDGILGNKDIGRQIALGTGAGLRIDLDGLVLRFDLGVGIHAPYQTFKYTKEGKVDTTQPINTYFNIPSALDALRFNFGIGYPF